MVATPPSARCRPVSRHTIVRTAVCTTGVGLMAAAAVGCDLSTEPAGEAQGPNAEKGTEAPSLAALVKAGELPPVADRLPDKPLVVRPTDTVGGYGGTWHSWLQGLALTTNCMREIGYDPLVRWNPAGDEVVPNIAESWEIDGEGRTYTIRLRKGIKWSDGTPFTADDIVFTYDDVLLNEELYPVPLQPLAPDGQPASLEKLDDHTIRFIFASPNGLFLHHLATPELRVLLGPRHYLEQFHPAYNPKAHELAADENFPSWVELFYAKDDHFYQNPDRPVLNAWKVVTPVAEGTDRGVYERNPYYWKVDPEGSQLPYIDTVTYDLIAELDVAVLKTTNGELDLNYPTFDSTPAVVANKPVLAQHRKAGDYRFLDGVSSTMNQMVIGLNLNHNDPVLRGIFQNRDFRIGLSHAINREELIDTVYQRQGKPWQAAPREESVFYDEDMATQYTEYDPDLASSYLDRAGYTERDGDGIRLRPDGKRLHFAVEVVTAWPEQIDALELIERYWRAVGVSITIKSEDRTLFTERIRSGANQHDASVWSGDGGLGNEILAPVWYLPWSWTFASRWRDWYVTRGADGDEPPEPARRQFELYDHVKASIDPDERHEAFTELLAIAKREFWVIGTVLPVGTYGTVQNTFYNVPNFMPASWEYPTPGPTRPEQYFVARDTAS